MARGVWFFFVALALMLAARSALSILGERGAARPFAWNGLAGCSVEDDVAPQWQPTLPGADHEFDLRLRCGDRQLVVHVGQYFRREPGKEAVGSPAHYLNGITPVRRSTASSGQGFDVNTYVGAGDGTQPMVVWQWYGIGGRPLISNSQAKLAEVLQVFTLSPTSSTVFLVAAVGEPAERQHDLLEDAVDSLWSGYLEQLP